MWVTGLKGADVHGLQWRKAWISASYRRESHVSMKSYESLRRDIGTGLLRIVEEVTGQYYNTTGQLQDRR